MGASGRRRSGRLTQALAAEAISAPAFFRLATPVFGVIFAGLSAIVVLAFEQLRVGAEGPWIEIGTGAIAAACFLAAGTFVAAAVRRRRDGLIRRSIGWAAAAAWAVLLAALAIEVLAQAAQLRSTLGGADTHATAPVLHALPRPAGATLVDERPGPGGTQSISDDLRVSDISLVPAFYRTALAQAGWLEDSATTSTDFLQFHRGHFEIAILLDVSGSALPHAAGDYSVTVDLAPGASG